MGRRVLWGVFQLIPASSSIQQKVELDRRRNQSREAVRALQKTKGERVRICIEHFTPFVACLLFFLLFFTDEQVWMGFGSFFCQLPRADAVRMANKGLLWNSRIVGLDTQLVFAQI